MEKFRYWSETNQRFIPIYAVVGESEVKLFYDNLDEFKTMSVLAWNMALKKGQILSGWE
jgi:hypothetical protein